MSNARDLINRIENNNKVVNTFVELSSRETVQEFINGDTISGANIKEYITQKKFILTDEQLSDLEEKIKSSPSSGSTSILIPSHSDLSNISKLSEITKKLDALDIDENALEHEELTMSKISLEKKINPSHSDLQNKLSDHKVASSLFDLNNDDVFRSVSGKLVFIPSESELLEADLPGLKDSSTILDLRDCLKHSHSDEETNALFDKNKTLNSQRESYLKNALTAPEFNSLSKTSQSLVSSINTKSDDDMFDIETLITKSSNIGDTITLDNIWEFHHFLSTSDLGNTSLNNKLISNLENYVTNNPISFKMSSFPQPLLFTPGNIPEYLDSVKKLKIDGNIPSSSSMDFISDETSDKFKKELGVSKIPNFINAYQRKNFTAAVKNKFNENYWDNHLNVNLKDALAKIPNSIYIKIHLYDIKESKKEFAKTSLQKYLTNEEVDVLINQTPGFIMAAPSPFREEHHNKVELKKRINIASTLNKSSPIYINAVQEEHIKLFMSENLSELSTETITTMLNPGIIEAIRQNPDIFDQSESKKIDKQSKGKDKTSNKNLQIYNNKLMTVLNLNNKIKYYKNYTPANKNELPNQQHLNSSEEAMGDFLTNPNSTRSKLKDEQNAIENKWNTETIRIDDKINHQSLNTSSNKFFKATTKIKSISELNDNFTASMTNIKTKLEPVPPFGAKEFRKSVFSNLFENIKGINPFYEQNKSSSGMVIVKDGYNIVKNATSHHTLKAVAPLYTSNNRLNTPSLQKWISKNSTEGWRKSVVDKATEMAAEKTKERDAMVDHYIEAFTKIKKTRAQSGHAPTGADVNFSQTKDKQGKQIHHMQTTAPDFTAYDNINLDLLRGNIEPRNMLKNEFKGADGKWINDYDKKLSPESLTKINEAIVKDDELTRNQRRELIKGRIQATKPLMGQPGSHNMVIETLEILKTTTKDTSMTKRPLSLSEAVDVLRYLDPTMLIEASSVTTAEDVDLIINNMISNEKDSYRADPDINITEHLIVPSTIVDDYSEFRLDTTNDQGKIFFIKADGSEVEFSKANKELVQSIDPLNMLHAISTSDNPAAYVKHLDNLSTLSSKIPWNFNNNKKQLAVFINSIKNNITGSAYSTNANSADINSLLMSMNKFGTQCMPSFSIIDDSIKVSNAVSTNAQSADASVVSTVN